MASRKELEEKIVAAARVVKGKPTLSCKAAFKLADELGVTRKVIGGICDRRGIKISGCQLGCF